MKSAAHMFSTVVSLTLNCNIYILDKKKNNYWAVIPIIYSWLLFGHHSNMYEINEYRSGVESTYEESLNLNKKWGRIFASLCANVSMVLLHYVWSSLLVVIYTLTDTIVLARLIVLT